MATAVVVESPSSKSPSSLSSPGPRNGGTGSGDGSGGGGFAALIGRFEKVAQSAQEKQTSLVVAHGGAAKSPPISPKRPWQSSSKAAASSGITTAANKQEEVKDQSQNKELTEEADDSESDDEEKERSGSAAPGSFAAVIEQFEKKAANAASNTALISSSEVDNTDAIRAPSGESNTRKDLKKSSNTNALLEIVTNASEADSKNENAAFVPTDDEATNNSQNDSKHSAEEETEALIKEALILSASSSNIPSSQLLVEEITSDENTDETHDEELNAFYKSIKQSKRKEDAFVPPSHILPHRSKKKRDAFGEHAPKQVVEIVLSQTEEKQVISKEIIQRCDSHHEDSTDHGEDPAVDHGIVREPGGHRIEENYSKPPPHYVEAQPSRRRQRIRKQQIIRQQLIVPSALHAVETSMPVIPEDTSASQPSQLGNLQQQPKLQEPQKEPQPIHPSSPATSLTSSEPRGKRLSTAYKASEIPGHHLTEAFLERRPAPKKVINLERLQSAQDCKGILPKNQMYPMRRKPVDVPGSKLPNKFPGQSSIEGKVTVLQQQVALAEQIIRLRTMKHESERLKASLKVQQTLVQNHSTTDNGGDGNDFIAQQQQEQRDASKKLSSEASFQNRKALLAKLTSQPDSLTDFQKKSALLAKLSVQPITSTQQKQQEVNSNINSHKYREQHHKELMEKFEDDSRVTQNMHDEMVKVVHASFESNTKTSITQPQLSQKQLLRQLEYDSLRQQLEYAKLMRKLGQMMATKAVPSDERQPNDRNSSALGRNTPIGRKEQHTKSPARKKLLDAPPVIVTVSMAPVSYTGLRTIDAIPVAGTKRSHSTRPAQVERAPPNEEVLKDQVAPAPQSQQIPPRASHQEEKTGVEEMLVAHEKSRGFELSKGWEKSIEKQQQKSEKDRWRQILASSSSLV